LIAVSHIHERKTMLKTMFASVIALAATISLAAGAAADTAVQHMNLNAPQQCQTFTKGFTTYTFCFGSAGEATAVQTSSGNYSSEINATFAYSAAADGAVISSGTDAIHEHVLLTKDFTVLQELGAHETSISTYGRVTCTFNADIHATGLNFLTGSGRIQYQNVTWACV
jgi:hypothetical protein